MQPLIDSDVLLYECGFAAETGWQGGGLPSWDYAAELLDNRIANICAMVGATKPPLLFLTGKTNFRNSIAKRQPYKERPSHKPFHYHNLKAYIKGKYDYRITEGLEADDLMAIEQTLRPDETIICTRDKDLRQVPGWHYGWELGNQPQFGPELVDDWGYIKLSADRKSIKGVGLLFFYSQLLTGDKVDTIPGLDGCGPVKAFELLVNTKTPTEALHAVYEAYKAKYGISAYKEMLEQGRLLWMTRKLRDDGTPLLWGQTK
jgi:5'-3' exonuclease